MNLPVKLDPSMREGTMQLVDNASGEVLWEIELPRSLSHVEQTISDWPGWPSDVQEVLRSWNRRHLLSFVRHGVFICTVCHRSIQSHPNGNAHLRTKAEQMGKPLCEQCLIAAARFAMYDCLPSVE